MPANACLQFSDCSSCGKDPAGAETRAVLAMLGQFLEGAAKTSNDLADHIADGPTI